MFVDPICNGIKLIDFGEWKNPVVCNTNDYVKQIYVRYTHSLIYTAPEIVKILKHKALIGMTNHGTDEYNRLNF